MEGEAVVQVRVRFNGRVRLWFSQSIASCCNARSTKRKFDSVKSTSFVPGLAWLLICQSIGEALSRWSHVGLPGPVIGMMLMLGLLGWEPVRTQVSPIANGLLMHLSLLFVPVGVGVMTHLALVSRYGWQLLVALVLSTWMGLLVTAVVFRTLLRRAEEASTS